MPENKLALIPKTRESLRLFIFVVANIRIPESKTDKNVKGFLPNRLIILPLNKLENENVKMLIIIIIDTKLVETRNLCLQKEAP